MPGIAKLITISLGWGPTGIIILCAGGYYNIVGAHYNTVEVIITWVPNAVH